MALLLMLAGGKEIESFDGLKDARKQAIAEMVSNYPIMQTWEVKNILGI